MECSLFMKYGFEEKLSVISEITCGKGLKTVCRERHLDRHEVLNWLARFRLYGEAGLHASTKCRNYTGAEKEKIILEHTKKGVPLSKYGKLINVMENDLNIGLCFSGGGYRAATFDLGTLSFLNSVRLEDGRTLLSCVSAMSSVSGGSIPALKYMLALSHGQSIEEMIDELFDFLCNEELVVQALQKMSSEKANRKASLIKIMAGIYDERLFNHGTMGDIIDNIENIPVKDYTALASDFDNALPFRFRVTEGFTTDGSRLYFGLFGNAKNRIGLKVARYITAGEALACSSCFPSGFEPMMYPDDFKVSQNPNIASTITKRFGLMDGGVTDNQGIESIVNAEGRKNDHREDKSRTDKALDLVIVSDVASPYMDGYEPSEEILPPSVCKLTFGRLRNYGLIAEAVVILLFILSIVLGSGFWTGVMSVVLAIVTGANILGALLKNKMFGAISKTFIGNNATFLTHTKFATLESLLMNRAKSVLMMSSQVFLKRMRQLNYDVLYDNPAWQNRRICTTVYELRPEEKWHDRLPNEKGKRKNKNEMELPAYLAPSDAVQQNSDRAASMGTTLWFTDKDKAAGIPQALMACGQYTMCFNLLDYLEKIEYDPINLNDSHKLLLSCKPQLLAAWEKFQRDPQCMLRNK